MSDPAATYLVLCLCAFAAGVMNSVAGGGTLLTFPALTAALGPGGEAVANATSTVALLPGSFAGAAGYRQELAASRKFVARMIAPSLAGGFLGAWLVVRDEQAFAGLVPWLILTAAVLFLIQQPVSAWMTQLADTADLDGLAKWAQKQGLKAVPVGAFEDADGPPAYKLGRDADVTVLLFVDRRVVANFAFRDGELTDAKLDMVAKALPKLFPAKSGK